MKEPNNYSFCKNFQEFLTFKSNQYINIIIMIIQLIRVDIQTTFLKEIKALIIKLFLPEQKTHNL